MAALLSILREVNDPRDFNARHELGMILFVALSATLCGAKSCVDIADFAAGRAEELREIVDLPHGPPSHDTFSRVFRLLDPQALAEAFNAFMTALRAELGLGPARGVVAVDGKSLRRGYEKGCAFMPPLMVSVWDTQTRLAIAQARAPGGNEIKATLDLLHSLVLKGCTVTGDALHCHPQMAQAIIAAKAHYVLGLKANHGPLFAVAQQGFAAAGAGLASFALPVLDWTAAAWLLPSLGLTLASLALATWLTPEAAAGVVTAVWIAVVAASAGAADDRLAAFHAAGQVGCLVAVAVSALVLVRRRAALEVRRAL